VPYVSYLDRQPHYLFVHARDHLRLRDFHDGIAQVDFRERRRGRAMVGHGCTDADSHYAQGSLDEVGVIVSD